MSFLERVVVIERPGTSQKRHFEKSGQGAGLKVGDRLISQIADVASGFVTLGT